MEDGIAILAEAQGFCVRLAMVASSPSAHTQNEVSVVESPAHAAPSEANCIAES